MLTENDIIYKLSEYLEKTGYKIIQRLSTNEKGVDLITENNEETLYIEAKGETSSKSNTNRYGKPFSSAQIKSHVSKAILASMQVLTSTHSKKKIKTAIALPDTIGHRKLINSIMEGLNKLEIKVFWVSEGGVESNSQF